MNQVLLPKQDIPVSQEKEKPEKIKSYDPLNGFIAMPYLILKMSMLFREATSTSRPNQQDIIEAAFYLCGRLRIDNQLWEQICVLMGQYTAALCVAIIAAKWERGKIRNGGGVMRAMIERFKTGDLHLDKSFYGLNDLVKKEQEHGSYIN